MVFGERCENLAVKRNILFLEGIDESAVREPVRPDRGVNPDIPERAEVRLFVFAVRERILASVHVGLPRGALLFGTGMTITFDLFQEGSAEFEGVYGFFDS